MSWSKAPLTYPTSSTARSYTMRALGAGFWGLTSRYSQRDTAMTAARMASQRNFRHCSILASLDLDAGGHRRFRTIALLDNDRMGHKAIAGITQGHRQIREYESIFSLKRVMPRKSGSIKKLAEHTRTINAAFSSLDCTIEDLLSDAFCESFVQTMPNAVERAAISIGGAYHRYWTNQGKRDLRLSVPGRRRLRTCNR